jgi:hypothetical protein
MKKMKRIFTLLVASVIAISSFAQYGQTVTLSFGNKNGKSNNNKDYQVVIDGRSYSSSNGNYNQGSGRGRDDRDNTWNDEDITLNNLQPGQHSIQVYRAKATNRNGNYGNQSQATYNSTFLVKQGYYLDLLVKPGGQIQYTETRVKNSGRGRDNNNGHHNNGGYNNGVYNNGNGGYNNNYPNQQYRTAMSDAEFNQLVQSVRSKWMQSGKVSAIQSTFSNQSYYFSTSQVRQLLEIVTAENNRLDLAKLAYRNVVDQANFRQLYDLLQYQSSRDDLDNYIRTVR